MSCSDDDDPKGSNTLKGTTWEYVEYYNGEISYKSTIQFADKSYTASGFENYGTGVENFSGTGTYIYDPPIVVFMEDGETFSGTIDSNKLTINNEDHFIFTKK